jgi:hypothetical protein
MKYFYAHVFGDYADYHDLYYSLSYAEVEKGEEAEALKKGFIPVFDSLELSSYWRDNQNIWFQGRQTRINLENFKWRRSVRRKSKSKNKVSYYSKNIKDTTKLDRQKMEKIFGDYIKHKFNRKLLEKDETYFYDYMLKEIDNREIIFYLREKKVIAFSCHHLYDSSRIISQFCWDYKEPRLGLGIYSLHIEVEEAWKRQEEYIYMGLSYGKCSLYKKDMHGFEFWTGREWTNDADLYEKMVTLETGLKTLKDLEELQDIYFENLESINPQ